MINKNVLFGFDYQDHYTSLDFGLRTFWKQTMVRKGLGKFFFFFLRNRIGRRLGRRKRRSGGVVLFLPTLYVFCFSARVSAVAD